MANLNALTRSWRQHYASVLQPAFCSSFHTLDRVAKQFTGQRFYWHVPIYKPWVFKPPLLPEQEAEVAVPSVQANMRHCHWVWSATRAALLRSSARIWKSANHCCSLALGHRPGQKVWFSSRDLSLQVESKNLVPKFTGPYESRRSSIPLSSRWSSHLLSGYILPSMSPCLNPPLQVLTSSLWVSDLVYFIQTSNCCSPFHFRRCQNYHYAPCRSSHPLLHLTLSRQP